VVDNAFLSKNNASLENFSFFCIKFISAIKRTVKIMYRTTVVLLLIPLFLYIFLQSSYVQTKLTGFISNYVSEKYHFKLTVGRVDIGFLNNIILEQVYIEDQHKDTLAYIDELNAKISGVYFSQHQILLQEISLKKTNIKLFKDSAKFNFDFLIDALSSSDTTSSSDNWKVYCTRLNIENSQFNIKWFDAIPQYFGMNYDDILVKNINLKINHLKMRGDSICFNISHLSATERSGFKLNDLKLDAVFKAGDVSASNILIITPNSKIKAKNYSMLFKDISSFDDFINRVTLKGTVLASKVNMKDITYYAPYLQGMSQIVYVAGSVKGPISDLKGKDIKLIFGDNTKIDLNFTMNGLPNIEETYMYGDFKKLITTKKDLELVTIPPFIKNEHLKLTEEFSRLGLIHYKGKFTGFINDFVAYGTFITDLGKISSDLSLKNDTIAKKIKFSGQVETFNFDIGVLTNNSKYLGKLSMDTKIEGYTLPGKAQALMDGTIQSIDINNYKYNNLKINGDLANDKFSGELFVDDPNIKMEFLGSVDFSKKTPMFDFTADVSNSNLYDLNIEKKDSLSELSFLLKAKFNGSNIDNMSGVIDLLNTEYKLNNQKLLLNNLNLTATTINDTTKNLNLYSDIADIEINGNFKLLSLYTSLQELIKFYIPSYTKKIPKGDYTSNLAFNIHLKETKKIFEIFAPDYYIAPNSIFYGKYNSLNNNFEFMGDTRELIAQKNTFKDLSIHATTAENKLLINAQSETFNLFNRFKLNGFNLISNAKNDSILFNVKWATVDSLSYKGDLTGLFAFKMPHEKITPIVFVKLLPSSLILGDTLWYINQCDAMIDSNYVAVKNFDIRNNNQFLNINGIISTQKEDSLIVSFKNINLANLNLLTKPQGFEFKGILNGTVKISDFYNNAMFYCNANIDSLFINNEQIGNSIVESNWDKYLGKLNIDFTAKRKDIETINIIGDYYPTKKEDQFDFDVKLNKLPLNIFEPYLKDILSNIRGMASGNLKLLGTTKKPLANGDIKLQKGSLMVDFLKTTYSFTDFLHIENNNLVFKNITAYDYKGNTALVNGKITHQLFDNMFVDLNISANNFFCLNTKEKDNSLFYGTAFASGLISIMGPPDKIKIKIDAKTEKDTKFNIPLNSSSEISSENFITFINKNTINEEDKIKANAYKVNLSGVELDFNLEVTPDAEVQIIFDSKMGDIIKGRGNSNLKMNINTLGDFSMYGNYVIDRGDYLFTLQNVINKRLAIKQGGTIKWDGDPYDATIDLSAIYNVRTSLYNLTLDSTYKQRIPVECELIMTNKLMKPNIDFDINLPTVDDNAKRIVSTLEKDEKNKQVLSLLVLGTFYTLPEFVSSNPNQERASGNAVGVNSSELLSNQLSNWLSQISNEVDIGVNYRPGDQISSDEVEVALSTQLLNDRVSLNGNVGVGKHQNTSSNIVGGFDMDVKINKSGKLRVKAYTRANDNIMYDSSPYIQGVGIFYKEDFDTVGELLKRYYRKIIPGKKKTEEVPYTK